MSCHLKRSFRLSGLAALAVLILLTGCGRTVFVPGRSLPSQPSSGHVAAPSLGAKADAAWQSGNMAEAERLYRAIGRDVAVPTAERALAWERVARAAAQGNDKQGALYALGAWKGLVPGVENAPEWQEIQNILNNTSATSTTSNAAGFNSGCVALALPMSGPYGPFGNKIADGANAAQKELARTGTTVDVRIVDTERPDWTTQLAQLPAQCVAVGGPLRADHYTQAKTSQLTAAKAFFAFLPSLEGNDEGAVAWRFFSSPQDQINAVLRFTRELGINQYGIIAPEDTYGRRMSALLLSSAGGNVKTASYAPGNPASSGESLRGLISGGTVQAAFIPDSWKNLELLLPSLFSLGEDRLVLMGTSLWEQGLSSRTSVNVSNLDLAVFPGAWNGMSPNPAANALIRTLSESGKGDPDFWQGIGFDFVRMASILNLQGAWTPSDVNSRLRSAQKMEWSIAPISWNNGRASQALFIFKPTQSGFEAVDTAAFKARLEEIRARHARRTGK